MTTVKRTLIGFQVLTLSLGLTAFVAGCGGSASTSSTGGMPIEDQVKQTENAKCRHGRRVQGPEGAQEVSANGPTAERPRPRPRR